MLLPTQVDSYYMEADKYQSQPATENANLQFLQRAIYYIAWSQVSFDNI